MDSDLTADSLSSPEHGLSMFSSFSVEGPADLTGSQRSGAPLNSFDLSPATDTSVGSRSFPIGRGQRLSPHEIGGGLTPLSESRRSSDISPAENTADNTPTPFEDIRMGTSGALGIPYPRDETVVAENSRLGQPLGSGGAPELSKGAAMTDGYPREWQQPQQRRLESSWPLSRGVEPAKRSDSGEDGSWGLSQPSISPSFLHRGTTNQPMQAYGAHGDSRSSHPLAGTGDDGGFSGRSSRGSRGSIDDGSESGGSRSETGSGSIPGDGGTGINTNSSRGSIISTNNDVPSSEGIGETSSVSEGSSHGLPAPPVIPSGPLPAIGSLNEHLLSQHQQASVDRERRLTADHMRRLNQVLAGHLAYAEVPKVHASQDASGVLSPAPSHGSAVGSSTKGQRPSDGDFAGKRNPNGGVHGSHRQDTLQRLILRAMRERNRNALTRSWVRLCRHTSWVAARVAPSVKEVATRGTGTETGDGWTQAGVTEERGADRREAGKRQRQALSLVVRIKADLERRSMFRGWSRLCLHAASLSAGEAASASATAVARASRAAVMEEQASIANIRAGAWAKVDDVKKEAAEADTRAEKSENLLQKERIERAKYVVTRICADKERRSLFRGWSRLCLHSASLETAEAISATETVAERLSRSEVETRKTAAALRKRAEVAERGERDQQQKRAMHLIGRVYQKREKCLLFRGWSRLCLHSASLNAAEGAIATATAAAREKRAEAMEIEASLATEKMKALKPAEAPSAKVAAAAKESNRAGDEVARVSAEEEELRRKAEDAEQISQECRNRVFSLLVVHRKGVSEKKSLFRGWNRLCINAASLSAAEKSLASITAAASFARASATDVELEAPNAKAGTKGMTQGEEQHTGDTKRRAKEIEQLLREQRVQRARHLIVQVCADKVRRSLFRGWSRLCLHAASLNAFEAISATATAAARSARDEAEGKKAAAVIIAAEVAIGATAFGKQTEAGEQDARHQRQKCALQLIVRLCRDRDRRSIFRGWGRFCLHMANRNAAESTTATDLAATRACQSKATEKESITAHEKAKTSKQAVSAAEDSEFKVSERGVDANTAKVDAWTKAQGAKEAMQEQGERCAILLIARICADSNAQKIMRGWSRLWLHTASLNATEGSSIVATTAAKAAQAETMENNVVAARTKMASVKELEQRDAGGASTLAAELEQREEDMKGVVRKQQERRAKMLITRMCGDQDRSLVFRGWSRLCLHAASLNAVEGISAAATATARALRAEAMGVEAAIAVEKAGDLQRAATASAEVKAAAAVKEQGQEKTEDGTILAGKIRQGADTAAHEVRERQRRHAKIMVTRVCRDHDRSLLFRGWSRLCLHAACLSAAEGASAATTAAARAVRANAMEIEAGIADEKAKAIQREAATSAASAANAAKEQARREAVGVSTFTEKLKQRAEEAERGLREQQRHRAMMLAASLNAIEGASATTTAAARAARAEAMEKEAAAAIDKAEAWRKAAAVSVEVAAAKEKCQREAAGASTLAAELKEKEEDMVETVRKQQERQAKMMIIRVCRDRGRLLLFRGWSRLRLHTACLNAVEEASAVMADARAVQTETMEIEPAAAAEKTRSLNLVAAANGETIAVAAAKEKAQQEVADVPSSVGALKQRAENAEREIQERQKRHTKTLITRVCRDQNRSLLFRGWSRLCLHAASLPSAEGSSAAATASARATRAEAMEKEAEVAVERAEAWRKAAAVGVKLATKENSQEEMTGVLAPVAKLKQRGENVEEAERKQQQQRTRILMTRICRDHDRSLLFRGWSRLCLHAASLSAAEGASATTTAAARALRAKAMEIEAGIADEKAETLQREAAASAANAAKEQARREAVGVSTFTEKLEQRAEEAERGLREQRRHRAMMMIRRVYDDKDRSLLFRGWSRLCLQAASLNAIEGASATTTAAARAARAEAMEKEAAAAIDKAEAWRKAAAASAEVAAAKEKCQREAAGASTLAAELKEKEEDMVETVRKQQERQAKMMIIRVCRDRGRLLLFRGWSRLCLHAASLSATEGASAAATAAARAFRAEAMEKEAEAAGRRAEACTKAGLAGVKGAVEKEQWEQEVAQFSTTAVGLERKAQDTEKKNRERHAKILITRLCRDRERAALFRGWSRLCLHAASLFTAKGTGAARAALTEAIGKKDVLAVENAEVVTGEHQQREVARTSAMAVGLDRETQNTEQVVQEQQKRRVKLLIARICKEKDRSVLFRGWSRLCLHAASLCAAEGASATVTASARVARAEAMEKEATAAAEKAEAWKKAAAASVEVAATREQAHREVAGVSTLMEDLSRKVENLENMAREQKKRQFKLLIFRLCSNRDRLLIFRGWSRLCFHAASLSAAEGASAAKTASARASRADAMEKEAAAAAIKAEAWKRAAAASAEVAAAKEQAQRQVTGVPTLADDLQRQVKDSEEVAREQKKRRARLLITRLCDQKDRSVLFRGWSRLCLRAASLSAVEGVSAAATAVARATRAEAMEKEAVYATEKADAWRKVAAASIKVAAAREQAQREASDILTLEGDLRRTIESLEKESREQQKRRAKLVITRIFSEKNRSLLFRGWSRLCLHAASLSAAEGASAAVTATARAARAEAMEMEAATATRMAEARKKAVTASAEMAAAREKTQQELAGAPALTEDLCCKAEDRIEVLQKTEQKRRAKSMITRLFLNRDRTFLFRGWSRLCLHAASLSAAEGISAAATATARAARAEAMELEAAACTEKAKAWKKVAAVSAEVAAMGEQAQREVSSASTLGNNQRRNVESSEKAMQEQHKRWAMLLISRICSGRKRSLLFRGWSRLCLHSASLSAAKGASVNTTAVARAVQAEAREKESTGATEKAEAWRKAAVASAEVATTREQAEREVSGALEEVVRQQKRRAKLLITRLFGNRDMSLLFRGWSRLCLHASSLSAAKGVSSAATATARATRAEVMKLEAATAIEKAEAWEKAAAVSVRLAGERKQGQQEVSGDAEEVVREQKCRAKLLITRLFGNSDRLLLFRGWSRLCLHAASLSAAEGASAAATATARAARVDAIAFEAEAAAEKAEVWEKAAVVSVEVAAKREQTQRKVFGDSEEVVREQKRRAKLLITRLFANRNRSLLFRGWSRLCLHAASLSAVEGASAAATATARAARGEAMEREAVATAEKAKEWEKAAVARTKVAAKREQAQREMSGDLEEVMGEKKSRTRLLITRLFANRERSLLFRGWSRLCLHAASLSAAETVSTAATATATARAARAEAMEKEAAAAAKKAEAWEKAAAASAEAAAAKEQAQQKLYGASRLAEGLKREVEDLEEEARGQQKRRAKFVINRVCIGREKALLFRGWSRLCLHAASLSAVEGALAAATAAARAARTEAMEKEAATAANIVAGKMEGIDLVRRHARAVVLLQRLNAGKNKNRVWRGWRLLCQYAVAACAVNPAFVAPRASVPSSGSDGPNLALRTNSSTPLPSTDNHEQYRKRKLRKLALRSSLRAERMAIARGWARLREAAVVAATSAAFTDATKKLDMTEAYAVDLQLQAKRRRRELDRKTRALAILLRDDWAKAVLDRERETRAAREQLAQVEADLEAQLDTMASIAAGRSGKSPGVPLKSESHDGAREDGVGDSEDPEVFSEEGEGARCLRTYLAGRGRDLRRARAEAQQWCARCGAMKRRLDAILKGYSGEHGSSLTEGKRLAAILVNMLDERDRRLSGLYSDLAVLATGDADLPSPRTMDGDQKRHARKKAGKFLLQQMEEAGEEARTHIHRLTHEVQRLTVLTGVHDTSFIFGQSSEFERSRSIHDGSNNIHGLEGKERGAPPQERGVLVGVRRAMPTNTAEIPAGEFNTSNCSTPTHEGVQAATDAQEIISSLRSEVSALERHRAALQARLGRFEDSSAETINLGATTDAWAIAAATAAAVPIPSDKALADGNENMPGSTVEPAAVEVVAAMVSDERRARAARAEKRECAATALRQALDIGESLAKLKNKPRSAAVVAATKSKEANEEMSTLAAAVDLRREMRRQAQKTFVSRRADVNPPVEQLLE